MEKCFCSNKINYEIPIRSELSVKLKIFMTIPCNKVDIL